jgi:hypothetical protein
MAWFLNNTDTPDIYDITGHGRFSMHPDFLKLFRTATSSTESKNCLNLTLTLFCTRGFEIVVLMEWVLNIFLKRKSEGVT